MVSAMADETVDEMIARITKQLRKDHPDPTLRAEMYERHKLREYVRALAPQADESAITRIATAVQHADDGTPAHDE